MKLSIKKFSELSIYDLYKILKLRYDVFIFEQKSIYEEFDEKDYNAIHIYIKEKKNLIGYSRIYKKSKKISCISRVVISKQFRKKGLGKKIVMKSIDEIRKKFKTPKIEISAQLYLKKFYENFGFKQKSKPYNDSGIMHIDMILE